MKYSELRSEWVYDWPQIIDDLEAGAYGKRQIEEVRQAAKSWVTCACGNQCAKLPRYNDDDMNQPAPTDLALRGMGSAFYDHIKALAVALPNYRWKYANAARKTLANIDARSAALLKAMQ